MAIKDCIVPLPDKRIILKTRPQGVYVYYTTRAFRNINKKPDSEQISIGKLDKKTGKMYPNKNYFLIFPENIPSDYEDIPTKISNRPRKSNQKTFQQSKSHGEPAAFLEIAKQSGLLATLQECFPSKWEKILAIASYMVSSGNVMAYIGDWFCDNNVNFTKSMDSSACSRLFESITDEERNLFFSIWVKFLNEQEGLNYDVTSMSTSSQNITLAEWGYNRDNDKLPQLNFGMYYGISCRLPMFYKLYNGSIPDKSYFEFMMKNAMDFGINKLCFVFDSGFVTESNIKFALDNHFSFVTSMPATLKESNTLIDKVKNEIERSENTIEGFNGFGISKEITLYGNKLKAHVYLDLDRKAAEFSEIRVLVDELEKELEHLNKTNTLPRRYSNYFIINKLPQNKIEYKRDLVKINEQISRTGYFILFTSNLNLTAQEVLKRYREKDVVEKNFDQLKNDLDFKRLKTHRTDTAKGKMFVGFIALILRVYMLQLLKNNKITKDYTFKTVKIELRKIQSAIYSDGTEELAPITKKQREILGVLNVDIYEYMKNN